jgi:hypothetical protein
MSRRERMSERWQARGVPAFASRRHGNDSYGEVSPSAHGLLARTPAQSKKCRPEAD